MSRAQGDAVTLRALRVEAQAAAAERAPPRAASSALVFDESGDEAPPPGAWEGVAPIAEPPIM